MKHALYFEKKEDNKVRCFLCPHLCLLKPGQTGICRVRTNVEGTLFSDNYGKLSAIHLDPIEKKPLYHYNPGKKILSIGSVGCNMQCNFCQNCEISQTSVKEFKWAKDYQPCEIIKEMYAYPENIGIAYTYNEPVIFYEFMFETARLVHESFMKNVMVSNGFIGEEPLMDLIPYMDAFNIDLKAFTEEFYKKETKSSLAPVKRTLEIIRESGKHLEITNLLIPSRNDQEDSFKEMIKWIAGFLGENTVLHLSRYFPKYHSMIEATSESSLYYYKKIAEEYLHYVYLGNTGTDANTICHVCKTIVIGRKGYSTKIYGLDENGNCSKCGTSIVKI